MSSTSLMSPSKCRLEVVIFVRQSFTRSGSSRYIEAMAVSPMMEFMGVRMSWLMELRKSVFARLARSASRKASSRALRFAISRSFTSVTSCTDRSTLVTCVAASRCSGSMEACSQRTSPVSGSFRRYSKCRCDTSGVRCSRMNSGMSSAFMRSASSSSQKRVCQ